MLAAFFGVISIYVVGYTIGGLIALLGGPTSKELQIEAAKKAARNKK